MKSSLLLVVLALSLVSVALGASFTYVEGTGLPGPSTWGTLSPVCSSGRFQSPLNIISSFGEYHANYGGLLLSYTKDSNVQITETGTGVVLTSTGFSDNTLTVSNVLNGTYVLDHVSFHWGQDNQHGSEHQIDFESAAGEIQFYHYSSRYLSYQAAVGSGDPQAVAAVAIFLVVGRSSPKNLTALINAMNTTAGPLSTTYAGPLDFTTLYPSASRKYYTYTGSLTSPSCDEVVQWFVLRSYVKITQNDINRLRKVPLQTGSTSFGVSFNYRPAQVYGTRKVTSNFIPNNGDADSASGVVASLVVLFAAIALMF